MRHLAHSLHGRGFTVLAPALPGHCTTAAHLSRTTWHDWYAGVVSAFEDLRRRCRQVAVVGQSLGGALALHLARDRGPEVSALVTLAAPLWLPPSTEAVVALYRQAKLADLLPLLPKFGGRDVRDPVMHRTSPGYTVMPMHAVLELHSFLGVVRRELSGVVQPLLAMHSRRDHTVPYACSRALVRGVASATVQHRTFTGSYHLLSIDIERDLVARETAGFLTTQLKLPALATNSAPHFEADHALRHLN
jgi:carboxylesterase